MSMAQDIRERCELERLLRAVQRHFSLRPVGDLAVEAVAARRELDERYYAALLTGGIGRLDEDGR